MDMTSISVDKEEELELAKHSVEYLREKIKLEISSASLAIDKLNTSGGYEQSVKQKILEHFSTNLDQLHHLFPSPYFIRADVRSESGEEKVLYFAKFTLMEQSVFSWMTPAARLRFSEIGPTSYTLPDGSVWSGTLTRKDQFMIVGGKIVFMTSESNSYGRTLIYQEQLSKRKAGFMLPEIVERMERAQDDVIRALAHGSFLIAGPAGSGKTTLAFHRIAYLLQSPDTASQFSSSNVIVFVQDDGTKAYFSRLLPDLGIHDVHVTTFGQWAMDRLELKDFTFIRRSNGVDDVIDAFEQKKRLALKSLTTEYKKSKNPFAILSQVYDLVFDSEDRQLFQEQENQQILDRFDLTILLELAKQSDGAFQKQETYYIQKKSFEVTRKTRSVPLVYSLIVVDEAQNYLPEQITLLRSCVASETKAMLYVGDLGQQVLLGTMRDWSNAGVDFAKGQKVQLEKVYRNTQKILSYIASLGFNVSVPEGLREGTEVVDEVCSTFDDEMKRIRSLIDAKDAQTQIGILSPSSAYLDAIKLLFVGRENVHILTIHESQGVEFDEVCLVGVSKDFFDDSRSLSTEHAEERRRIKRDLIYVALTRAMEGLTIYGRTTLKELFSSYES